MHPFLLILIFMIIQNGCGWHYHPRMTLLAAGAGGGIPLRKPG
jgi:hypothetical protein